MFIGVLFELIEGGSGWQGHVKGDRVQAGVCCAQANRLLVRWGWNRRNTLFYARQNKFWWRPRFSHEVKRLARNSRRISWPRPTDLAFPPPTVLRPGRWTLHDKSSAGRDFVSSWHWAAPLMSLLLSALALTLRTNTTASGVAKYESARICVCLRLAMNMATACSRGTSPDAGQGLARLCGAPSSCCRDAVGKHQRKAHTSKGQLRRSCLFTDVALGSRRFRHSHLVFCGTQIRLARLAEDMNRIYLGEVTWHDPMMFEYFMPFSQGEVAATFLRARGEFTPCRTLSFLALDWCSTGEHVAVIDTFHDTLQLEHPWNVLSRINRNCRVKICFWGDGNAWRFVA